MLRESLPAEARSGTEHLKALAEAAFRVHCRELERHFSGLWATYYGTRCLGIGEYPTEIESFCAGTFGLPQQDLSTHHISIDPSETLAPLAPEESTQILLLTVEEIQALRLQLFRMYPIQRLKSLIREDMRKLW